MKSYEERLPLIGAAIEYYKGKLPREYNPDSTLIIRAYRSYYFISEEYFDTYNGESEFVCYEEEFEQRAKELGWISGYKWGVEYKTNGKKPNLPDDVSIEIECARGNRDLGARLVKYNAWNITKSFRIIDKRYAPTAIPNKRENVIWDGEGMPNVGDEVEVWIDNTECWAKVKVLAVDGRNVVWRNGSDGKSYIGTDLEFVRPIQSEHERLINQARTLPCPMDVFHEPTARVMIEAGWRPTKEEK